MSVENVKDWLKLMVIWLEDGTAEHELQKSQAGRTV